jgi:predicted TIM-barrel fold metal-dependent hydrolase
LNHRLRRRLLLGAGAAAAGMAGIALWRLWPEQGFSNPCRAALPADLANHEVIRAAWHGIDPGQTWDCHAHLVGTGDSGSGAVVNERMWSPLAPLAFAQLLFYLNAGCVHNARDRVDEAYIERMQNLVDDMAPGFKLVLFAFDAHVRTDGEIDWQRTSFHVPDRYAAEVARRQPRYFEWAASIHPYRLDALARLEQAARDGARAVKWLPAAMGIDPASPRCDSFFQMLARLDLPLVTHAGHEAAVAVGELQSLNNPLKLRRALEHGVRVVVAHCASLGEDHDLDRGPSGPITPSFDLFKRLMDDPRYEGKLFGDLAAMTQRNRVGVALHAVIERTDWHARLLNGSDYPLPGVMPLFSLDQLAAQNFVPRQVAEVLKHVREHNPLLFDFALKRHLSSGGKQLSAAVFETRRFFDPAPLASQAPRAGIAHVPLAALDKPGLTRVKAWTHFC